MINSDLIIFYESTTILKLLYSTIMNKEDKDTIWQFAHIFDSVTFVYEVLISGGARTLKDNGIVLLTVKWIEADI